MSEHQFKSDEVPVSGTSRQFDRRSLVKASAILGAAGMVAVGTPVFAQDATPAASPVPAEAEGGAETPNVEALPTMPPEIEEFANDWPMAQQNYAATRHATGSVIDSSNVSQLGVAWERAVTASAPFGAVTSNPLIVGDRVYLLDNNANVDCLDRESGEEIWRVENGDNTDGPNGLAIGYGVLIAVLGDTAQVQALNPETGEELWKVQLTTHFSLGITVAPIIHDGVVIVSTAPGGNTKGRYGGGANGVVYALDIRDGVQIWSWDTVDEDHWGNFRVNSGGGLWYPPAIDTETGVLYMGIGNAAPFPGVGAIEEYPNLASRPGENRYANCLVALDPNLGRVLWYINVKPRDAYDHDNQQTPVLGTVTIGGQDADLVFTSGKHGYIVAAHRGSGHELWRRSVGLHLNDGLLELPEEPIEVYPGIWGGVQSPMAFADGVLYAAVFNWSTMLSSTVLGGFGEGESFDLSTSTGELVALDGATGDFMWKTEIPMGITGPGPVVSNDLIFTGTLDGIVRAFNRNDGSEVWQTQLSAGINAPFAVAGDMLIVPAGSFIVESSESPDPLPGLNFAFVAFKVGATGEVTMGSVNEQSTESWEAPASGDATEVAVSGFDLGFAPMSLSIPADTDVAITLTNDGLLQHDLVIEGTDYATPLIDGGTTAELVVNLPAGEYVYFCSVAGHRPAGMEGTLSVA